GASQIDWTVTTRAIGPGEAVTLAAASNLATGTQHTSSPGTMPSFGGTVQVTAISVSPGSAVSPQLLVGAGQTVTGVGGNVPSGAEVRLRVTPLANSTSHTVTATLTGGMTISWTFTTAAGSATATTGSCNANSCAY